MNRQPKTSLVEGFEQKTRSALGLGYAPQEEGTTIRPPSSSLFCVSSADRYKTVGGFYLPPQPPPPAPPVPPAPIPGSRRVGQTTPFRFSITKNESLLNGFISRLALTEVRFPWTLPNVSADVGTNTLIIDLSGGSGVGGGLITLTSDFYTPDELAAAIQDEFNTTYGPTFEIDCIALSKNGIFSISGTAGEDVRIRPNPAITDVNTKQLYDLMNWPEAAQTYSAVQLSGVPNLRWTDYIDIVCSQLTYNQDLKDSSSQNVVRDMLCRVYLDDYLGSDASYAQPDVEAIQYNAATPPVQTGSVLFPTIGYGGKSNGCRPFTIYRQFQSPKFIKWSRIQPIGQVVFEVFDDQGRCLADIIPPNSFFAGNDWNITMLASEQ